MRQLSFIVLNFQRKNEPILIAERAYRLKRLILTGNFGTAINIYTFYIRVKYRYRFLVAMLEITRQKKMKI